MCTVLGMGLSEKIDLWIKNSGRSAADLAERAGVGKASVSRWRTGDSEPDRENLVKLARAMRVSLDWLLDDAAQDELPEPDPDAQELAMLVRHLGAREVVRRVLGAKDAEPAPPIESPAPLVRKIPEADFGISGSKPRGHDKRADTVDTPPGLKGKRRT